MPKMPKVHMPKIKTVAGAKKGFPTLKEYKSKVPKGGLQAPKLREGKNIMRSHKIPD